jgi:hypothetical protein
VKHSVDTLNINFGGIDSITACIRLTCETPKSLVDPWATLSATIGKDVHLQISLSENVSKADDKGEDLQFYEEVRIGRDGIGMNYTYR